MITLNAPIQCAWRRPMPCKTRAHVKCRSRLTLRASAQTDVKWAKYKFVMYSVLRDPAVCVLPRGDYSKLVDGSAFATDINHDRQPYNVFVVDDDDKMKDYGLGRVLRARNMSSCSVPVYYVAVVWPMDGGNDVKDYKCYLANCNQDQSKLERVVFGPILIEEVRCVTGYFDENK